METIQQEIFCINDDNVTICLNNSGNLLNVI